MRATVAPASLRAPAKKPSVLSGVARMSEAISGKTCPAYRCAHAGYGCAGVVASASEETLRVERCSPDERRRYPGKTAPHIAALMRATVAPGALRAPAKKRHVKRCSPDERSDIRERLPRISLRSCGLRLRRGRCECQRRSPPC